MSDDSQPAPPYIPGWMPLPTGLHELPEHRAVLTWFPDKHWDGEPIYYVPDTEREKPAPAVPPLDDHFLKLEILRLLSTPGRPPSTEAAQRFYDWITGTATTHPAHPTRRRTHDHHA